MFMQSKGARGSLIKTKGIYLQGVKTVLCPFSILTIYIPHCRRVLHRHPQRDCNPRLLIIKLIDFGTRLKVDATFIWCTQHIVFQNPYNKKRLTRYTFQLNFLMDLKMLENSCVHFQKSNGVRLQISAPSVNPIKFMAVILVIFFLSVYVCTQFS